MKQRKKGKGTKEGGREGGTEGQKEGVKKKEKGKKKNRDVGNIIKYLEFTPLRLSSLSQLFTMGKRSFYIVN